MHHEAVLLTVALALVAGVGCQFLARLLKMPAIVPLLAAGVVMGPDALAVVRPGTLGEGLRVLVGLAVGVILFEGGLSLKLEAFRLSGRAIRNLVLVGALVTWWAAAFVAWVLLPELGAGGAILFGALVIVTGPTVILPLIQAVHPHPRVADVLRGEAVLVDPLGALIAVLVLELLLESATGGVLSVVGAFAGRLLLGAGLGAGGAAVLHLFLRRSEALAHDLRNLAVLATAVGLYAASELVLSESGVLAVTAGGFVLGWLRPPGIEEIEEFKGHVTVLMVSTVFVLLAANLSLEEMTALGWPGVLVVLALIFVVRPLAVFLATPGTDLTLRERLFLSWVAPRGIVAAAVASLFALLLEAQGFPEGRRVMALTFLTIIGTVVLQGPTAKPVARMLGVLATARDGFLVVGGNTVGRSLAQAMVRLGPSVMVVDTNPVHVRRCREAGLPARKADALDEVAMEAVPMDSIGNLLALTPSDGVNRLAVRLYAREFGPGHVRAVRLEDSPEKEETSTTVPYLFGDRLSWEGFRDRLQRGWTVESARVDANTDAADLAALLGEGIPLMAFAGRRVRYLAGDEALNEGETLLYLAPGEGGHEG